MAKLSWLRFETIHKAFMFSLYGLGFAALFASIAGNKGFVAWHWEIPLFAAGLVVAVLESSKNDPTTTESHE
jgi:hypothetical protein